MTTPMTPRKHILHFEVATDAQAAEWVRRVRKSCRASGHGLSPLRRTPTRSWTERDHLRVKDRADYRGTSGDGTELGDSCGFSGLYDGGDYPFDLTDLRALDTELANACIDYLNYDRLAKAEVPTQLPDSGRQMQWFMTQRGIRQQPRLSSTEAHEPRLHALAEHLDREPDAILKDALGDVLARYEGKTFGGPQASQPSPDEDRPLIHARLLSESAQKPRCGATDGPWGTRAFDFKRLTCPECQALVLNPKRVPT